jgi:hypothetical protein
MNSKQFFEGLQDAFTALKTGDHWGGTYAHDIEELIENADAGRKDAAFLCLTLPGLEIVNTAMIQEYVNAGNLANEIEVPMLVLPVPKDKGGEG